MKLINKTTNEILLDEVLIADSFFKRFMGLMGKPSLRSGTGLKIEPCSSIHCFFMKFPIDVLFVSSDDQVIKIIRNLKPWRVSPVVMGAKYVIEANGNELIGKINEGQYISYVP